MMGITARGRITGPDIMGMGHAPMGLAITDHAIAAGDFQRGPLGPLRFCEIARCVHSRARGLRGAIPKLI